MFLSVHNGCISCGVVPRDSIAAFPIAEACVGALFVLKGQRKPLSVHKPLSALFDAWSRFHEERTALAISNVWRARSLPEVGDDFVDESVR